MSLSVNCPSCGKQYSVPEEAAGKTARCRNCGQVMQLPGRAAPMAPEPAPLYTCGTCGRQFAVDDVYDQQGQVICKGCFDAVMTQQPPVQSPASHGLVCAGCGATLDPAEAEQVDGRMLCADCAMTVAAQAALTPVSGSSTRRNTRQPGYGSWIVGGTVAAAVLIGVVIVVTRLRSHEIAQQLAVQRSLDTPQSMPPKPPALAEAAQTSVPAAAVDWERSNGPKVTALRKEAMQLELAGDYSGATAKFQELFALANGAKDVSPALRQELADAHNSWDAIKLKLSAGQTPTSPEPATDPSAASQPAESRPVASSESWEQQHRPQIAQLLKLAQTRAAANDKFKAALAYQELFDAIGTHLADIHDPALKKEVEAAAADRSKLLGQVKASPEAVTLTADALVSSGLEALERRQWRAGLESFADVRMLFDRNLRSPAERVRNRDYLVALHGLAVAYMRTKQMPKAGELFAGESDPLCQQIARDPTRQLVINRAVVDITQKTKTVRAAKTLKEYLEKHSGEADETTINLLGTAIAVGEEHTAAHSFLNQCAEFYLKLNEQLEKSRPGEKRWGVQWLPAEEAQRKFDEKRKALQDAQRLTQQTNAAFNEWERQKQLYQPSGPDRLRHTSKANVDAAEARFHSLQAAAEEARKSIPSEPWLTDLEPVLPVPRRTQVAEVQPADPASSTVNPPTAPEPPTPPAAQDTGTTATAPEPPTAAAPTPVAVQRRALAFAIDRQRLVTSAEVIGAAAVVRLKDAQGTGFNARVVAKQEPFALLEVDLADLGGRSLAFFNIASSFTGGAVRCSAIPDENIFGPEPKLLAGQGSAPPAQGEWYVSLSDHPRLPASPLLNANSEIVGVVFPVTRDDPRTHLRCRSIKQLRDFLSANSALPGAPSANPDQLSVFEVTVDTQADG